MKKMRKRISLLLTVILVLSLCGCGNTKTDNKTTDSNSKDYVYTMEVLPLDMSTGDISDACIAGDTIYISDFNYLDGGSVQPREGDMKGMISSVATTTEDTAASEETASEETADLEEEQTAVANSGDKTTAADGEAVPVEEGEEDYVDTSVTEFLVGAFKMDGSKTGEFKLTLPTESGTSGFCADSKGNIYIVLDEYGKDVSNPDNIRDAYTLICYNMSGEEVWRAPLGEDIGKDDYYYVNRIMLDKDENILMMTSKGLEIYSSDAKKINEVAIDDENSGDLITIRDKQPAIICYGDTAQNIKTLDMTTGKLSDAITLPFNSYAYSYYSGDQYDLYMTDSNGVYGYNLQEENYVKIMDFVDSDIMANNLYNLKMLDDKTLFGMFYDEEAGKTVCAKFTKVDPNTIKDKEVLTLGCNYLDTDIRKHVIDYNKKSDQYRIKVVDYSSYNTEADYQAGQNKLNTDIVSGNMPDILIASSDMPIESYVAKGLFADLNTFVENDSEIKKEDYLPNIWEALSTDGKLYQIAPSFYIFTVFGKTSEVGSESGWTLDDLSALMQTKEEGVAAFNEVTRQDILNYSMWLCSEQFIDWSTGTCSFNSEAFTKLLQFAKQYPEEIKYPEGDDEDYWNNYQTMYREDRALLMLYTISNFTDYNNCEQGTFGEAITPIGFPTDNKKGSALNFGMDFAISAKSKNQQEAWNFVRYFLTDEYQDTIQYNLPVKIKQLDKLAGEAQQKPFYLDENGQKVEYDNTYYLNGVDVVIDPMTKEATDKVMTFIQSVDQVMNYNSNISDIVIEESAPYFEGQKTEQEVADIIQSRIQIYVNENR